MEHLSKRSRNTKESIVEDIASSIESVAETLASISDTQKYLLRANKVVVTYLDTVKRLEKEVPKDVSAEELSSFIDE